MKHLMATLLLFCMTAANAQTVLKGDMNNDKQLTIADVMYLVNVILSNNPQEVIYVGGDPYTVDNSLVVGEWAAPDESSFTLNEDGTTTFPNAATYKFFPVQGVLTMYDSEGSPQKAIVVNELTAEYLMAVDYSTNTFTKYTKQTHEYVDLGLPSGTLWAICNVGAKAPEEYGKYFSWGETEPKDFFHWSTYKWCNGAYDTMTKYCTDSDYGYEGFTDGKTELDPEDDAAYVNWGSSWRMPTTEQQRELLENCTSVWTTQNGVNGRLFTGPNENTLFLPAAGSNGGYWTRTLNSAGPYGAHNLDIDSENVNRKSYARYYGHAVRAVRVP